MDENLKFIEDQLIRLYVSMGIDTPINHDSIVAFVYDDIIESGVLESQTSEDVRIAFRRYLESKPDATESDIQTPTPWKYGYGAANEIFITDANGDTILVLEPEQLNLAKMIVGSVNMINN
jgi:hypothetical protein